MQTLGFYKFSLIYKSYDDIAGYSYNFEIDNKLNMTEVYKKWGDIRNEKKFADSEERKALCHENRIESESVIKSMMGLLGRFKEYSL